MNTSQLLKQDLRKKEIECHIDDMRVGKPLSAMVQPRQVISALTLTGWSVVGDAIPQQVKTYDGIRIKTGTILEKIHNEEIFYVDVREEWPGDPDSWTVLASLEGGCTCNECPVHGGTRRQRFPDVDYMSWRRNPYLWW